MFKNYLKTAWRNLRKNKGFSAINIIGLAIGMTACILIMVFVVYEKNFDGIHTKNIYRLNEVQKFEGMVEPQNVALSMFPMGPTIKAEFPEVVNFTRVRQNQKVDINIPGKKIILPYVYFVDSTFLQMFDFKLLEGDRATAVQNRNSAVLTKSTAKKIFGEENAMGKTIQRYSADTISFTVTGIMEDIPSNSHMQFDALFSFNTIFRPDMMSNWGSNGLVTYLELAPNTNASSLQAKFPGYLKKHMAESENWKYYELFLQPLKEVHSGSTSITHDYVNFQKFDKTYTRLFIAISIIILLIACINFMNLSTARSAERAREVGIRKSIGAARFQLGVQFIGESVLLCFIALAFAFGLAKLLLPYVESLSRRDLQLSVFTGWELPVVIIGGTLLVGVIAGLYPAVYLSGFRPVKVLKGLPQVGKNRASLRNVLVVAQFAGAIFLIVATVFTVKQLRFMQKKDPGFRREQVMIMPLDRRSSRHFEAVKKELLNNSLVAGVTGSQQRLGNNLHQAGMVFHGKGPARELTSSQVVVDPDYLNVYKIGLVAGRNFTHETSDNATTYIINETLAKELLKGDSASNMESLLGRNFGFGGMDSSGRIIGIAKDFNFNSLHHKIETLAIFNQQGWGYSEIAVRINGQKAQDAVAFVEATWKKIIPDKPFEYSFLDDDFQELYRADSQVSVVVGVLATLAIIISCLGLFGLASYSAERKFKEIGIRKVLGASVHSIVLLLSGSFLRLILIANLIALPLAWWAMDKWLQDFAFRISISGWIFIGAGLLALLIALITVSMQAIRAAVANPVKSLRTE